jgi:hypothetical protein
MTRTRAYLAGLGTAGSLLAGAAVLFLLASALVSFHGWPAVTPRPSARRPEALGLRRTAR